MTRPVISGLTWATDDNYASGDDTGLATKVAPSDAVRAQGMIPGTGAPAGRINSVLHDHGQMLSYYQDIDWLNLAPVHLQALTLATLDQGSFGAIARNPLAGADDGTHYVAVCLGSDHAYSSPDGYNWIDLGSMGTVSGVEHPRSIMYSAVASLWIVAASGGSTTHIVTTPDLSTWTPRTDPHGVVTYRGSLAESSAIIVMVSDTILSSADAATWTDRGNPGSGNLRAVTYSPELDLFVAVGLGGCLIYSANGTAWTDASMGAVNYTDVVWDAVNGRFIACGAGAAYAVSADGITWVAYSVAGDVVGDFAFLATDGGTTYVATTADNVLRTINAGASWDLQLWPSHIEPGFAVVLDGRLMLVGQSIADTTIPGIAIGIRTSPLVSGITPP